jgi:hypothetical protein
MISLALLFCLAQGADAGTSDVAEMRDVGHFVAIGLRYDAAVSRKDSAAIRAVEGELRAVLKRELAAMRARSDADTTILKKPYKGDGGIDEKRRDARQDMRIGGRLFAIDNALAVLEGKVDPASVDARRVLLDQLIGLAEQERRRELREKHPLDGGVDATDSR